MGMYTDFIFNLRLKDDISGDILEVLRYMVWDYHEDYSYELELKNKEALIMPDHQLFKLKDQRWERMCRGESLLIKAQKYKHITATGSIKDYNDEIKEFLNWITPYLHDRYRDGDCLGYEQYEECYNPSYVYYHGETGKKPEIKIEFDDEGLD